MGAGKGGGLPPPPAAAARHVRVRFFRTMIHTHIPVPSELGGFPPGPKAAGPSPTPPLPWAWPLKGTHLCVLEQLSPWPLCVDISPLRHTPAVTPSWGLRDTVLNNKVKLKKKKLKVPWHNSEDDFLGKCQNVLEIHSRQQRRCLFHQAGS